MNAAPSDDGAAPRTGLSKMTDLVPRLISGVVIAVVALLLLWLGGWWSTGLVAVLAGLMAWEWRAMTFGAAAAKGLGAAPAIAAAVISVLSAHVLGVEWAVAVVLVASAVTAGLDAAAKRPWEWSFGGMVYISLASATFAALRNEPEHGFETTLWIALVVVATDIGGYFAGRLIGGPKLWPRVSPKKTWAGLGGGVTLAAVVGWLFSWATTGTYFYEVAIVSMLAAVISQGGDLAESSVKRHFGVKDASTLIPGHGGVLDRLDGFMAATLVAGAATFWRATPMFIW